MLRFAANEVSHHGIAKLAIPNGGISREAHDGNVSVDWVSVWARNCAAQAPRDKDIHFCVARKLLDVVSHGVVQRIH